MWVAIWKADAARVLEEAQAVYFTVDAGSPEYVPQLVKAWSALGQRQKIMDLQSLLLEARARRYMPATFLACTHAALDDEKATLAMMRDAAHVCEERRCEPERPRVDHSRVTMPHL